MILMRTLERLSRSRWLGTTEYKKEERREEADVQQSRLRLFLSEMMFSNRG